MRSAIWINAMPVKSVLEVQNISFGYNGDLLLKDVSFAISAGELIALIGPNGSGKTTLLRIMLGLLQPHSGTVSLHGRPLAEYPALTRALNLAYVSQQPASSFPLTVRELVSLGRYPHGRRGQAILANSPAVTDALERTGANHLADRRFNTLSGGEKQKTLIARALAQNAPILLLDEPTLHLDLYYQIEILMTLKRLCVEQGNTVIAVLHDVNLVSLFADKALLLRDGALHGFGPVSEVVDEASISALLGIEMTAITGNNSSRHFFAPRPPFKASSK